MIKLCIVGGGPSGFYVASRLASLYDKLTVHIYDRLWSPHGLVRYGVAPDHPEVKNCTHKFDETAKDPRIQFFGNVNVGDSSFKNTVNLPLAALLPHYTHLLIATGCPFPTLHPALPPSSHCIPALDIVHWYTNHPYRASPPPLEQTPHVTLIGHGNVSLDIARILLSPPSLLANYDLPAPVLNTLVRSAVKHVSIVGRRGPLEASFTTKELREMISLPGASMLPLDKSLLSSDIKLTRQQSRTLDLLRKGSAESSPSQRTWSLDFFRSPTSLTILPARSPSRPIAELTLAHTTLDPDTRRAINTCTTSSLPTSLVITSLGFRPGPSLLLPSSASASPNTDILRVALGGRVVSSTPPYHVFKNVYASGWAATGARGVLASTMRDAYAVAERIIADALPSSDPEAALEEEILLTNTQPHPTGPPPEVRDALEQGDILSYDAWRAIDAEEIRRGQLEGKERERMDWEEARAFLHSQAS